MIIIKIILAILIILTVVNVFWGLFLGDGESILTAGIFCFFTVGILIMMSITSNTADKAQDDSSTVCEEVVSESIEKETAETVVNETPEITKTVETETAKVETDKAVEELIDSFKGEDSVEGEKSSETSEETEGIGMGTIIIIMLIIFSPALLFIGLDLIEDIIDCSSDFVGTCFLKKKKETALESIIKETDEDNPFMKKISTPKQKNEINIDKLAEKDSKIAYIVWAVKFLNDQGKGNYTRKLENYYIPEIIQAYEQYHKVKNFHVKEMTAEAKKHYEKIIDLSYKVANVEVKKAAGEIVMDMDCNADVCEDIYKRDGYCSMQEEIEKSNSEKHMSEKKKEQALHAKAISKDTYVFWTSEK